MMEQLDKQGNWRDAPLEQFVQSVISSLGDLHKPRRLE